MTDEWKRWTRAVDPARVTWARDDGARIVATAEGASVESEGADPLPWQLHAAVRLREMATEKEERAKRTEDINLGRAGGSRVGRILTRAHALRQAAEAFETEAGDPARSIIRDVDEVRRRLLRGDEP